MSDMSHLSEQMRDDCMAVADFAVSVLKSRKNGLARKRILDQVAVRQTNDTGFLEALVKDIYAIDLEEDKNLNIYNYGWNKFMKHCESNPHSPSADQADGRLAAAVSAAAWGGQNNGA